MLRNSLRRLLSWIGRLLLSLRYRVEVRGLEEVRARGTNGVIFLPSHLALIDPAILTVLLDRSFLPRALGDEYRSPGLWSAGSPGSTACARCRTWSGQGSR
jgi:1-acyl-sn-glycerol-3-phosphate acyltransferase